jgi:hypothetical protein
MRRLILNLDLVMSIYCQTSRLRLPDDQIPKKLPDTPSLGSLLSGIRNGWIVTKEVGELLKGLTAQPRYARLSGESTYPQGPDQVNVLLLLMDGLLPGNGGRRERHQRQRI